MTAACGLGAPFRRDSRPTAKTDGGGRECSLPRAHDARDPALSGARFHLRLTRDEEKQYVWTAKTSLNMISLLDHHI